MRTMEEEVQMVEQPERKVLYFEGAGIDFYDEAWKESDVGNVRIRTAFTNDQGDQYYLELERGRDYRLHVSFLRPIAHNNSNQPQKIHETYENSRYTKQYITNWINNNLGCSYDTIEVLSQFHGYWVHRDRGSYNLIDNHIIDHEQAAKRAAAYENIDREYRLALHEKHSTIYLQGMDDTSITICCNASENSLQRAKLPRIQRIEIR
ncbi:hypothetical protein [Paenibacillus glucanolyticus]|uniref:hypothetical protein n=1 Tax=Paenibacillus glucanolyticus TaxID=59843 RepID=UPI00096F7FE6|nr:hypothetical protein [Paenibacillus glucanolyticus]OMF76720.1 hypothetical protein BK142_14460 [Paenibacillus glucanolyticus]